jgi:hypothetical protein
VLNMRYRLGLPPKLLGRRSVVDPAPRHAEGTFKTANVDVGTVCFQVPWTLFRKRLVAHRVMDHIERTVAVRSGQSCRSRRASLEGVSGLSFQNLSRGSYRAETRIA